MRAKVHVFLKPGVLDVQGKAVENALHGLGWSGVEGVRVGKTIEFDAMVRIDTPEELVAFKHGGILPYVLRGMAQAPKAA